MIQSTCVWMVLAQLLRGVAGLGFRARCCAGRGMRAPAIAVACASLIAHPAFVAFGQSETLPTLSEGMVEAAGKVRDHIESRHYAHVGVLKFLARNGSGEPSTDVGSLNSDLATRLESALVLLHQKEMDYVVLANASRTAAGLPGASILTPEGLKVLFGGRYQPAWRSEDAAGAVPADALIAGVVALDPKAGTADVSLLCYSATTPDPEKVYAFKARLAAGDRVPAGQSFTTRAGMGPGLLNNSMFDRLAKESDQPAPEKSNSNAIVKPASASSDQRLTPAVLPVGSKDASLPADFLKDAPVEIAIKYGDKAIPIEVRDGKISIREPIEGDAVSIRVAKKNRSDKRRIGVVLKVNGENTAKIGQRLADVACWKWILSDDRPQTVVLGFHDPDKKLVSPFRVGSLAESRQKEYDFGDACGQISVTLFDEEFAAVASGGTLDPTKTTLDDNAKKRADVLDSTIPIPQGTPAKTAGELKENLFNLALGGRSASRGLILQGATQQAKVDKTDFKPNPTPSWAVVVRYFEPGSGGTAASGGGTGQ